MFIYCKFLQQRIIDNFMLYKSLNIFVIIVACLVCFTARSTTVMISPKDFMERMGVGASLVPFFKCVCVYFAVGGDAPSAATAAAKCAPVLCLLLAVALRQRALPPPQRRYARLVCGGLALSALGDALLVWPALLAAGMGAFLLAHACYLGALGWRPLQPLRGAALALLAAGYVRATLGAARGPAAALAPAYALALAAMAWRALARGGAAAAGALLFVVSDALLGWALFAGALPHRRELVMSTYYLGQLGLALSALRPRAPRAEEGDACPNPL